jgi:dipeptidyl aminopeptidase/acylaminoacyl peptidase
MKKLDLRWAIAMAVASLASTLLAQTTASPPAAPPASTPAAAPAAPPATDIFLADLDEQGGVIKVGIPRNLTNRDGYDNQPSFAPDGKSIFYTSGREDGQTDIYRYDLAGRHSFCVRHTPESEYSPTVMPDGSGLSVIRVEADKTQRLWRLPFDTTEPDVILKDVKPVGYHVWADEKTLVLFVLGTPPTLQIADRGTGKATVLAENPGRSLHRVPGRAAVSFVHKVGEKEWWIKELDLATRAIRPLVRTREGSEDFAWTPDGTLLAAQGAVLYAYHYGQDKDWREVTRFGDPFLQKVTRLAVSPKGDRLALVSERPAKKP